MFQKKLAVGMAVLAKVDETVALEKIRELPSDAVIQMETVINAS